MKIAKVAATALIICGLAAGGYAVVQNGWTVFPSESADAPRLAEAPEDGETGAGGQIAGEAGGDNTAGGGDENGEGDSIANGQAPDDLGSGETGEEGGAAEGEGNPPAGQARPSSGEDGAMAVIAQPASIAVLVNKFNMLPEDFEPDDLVYPDVRFTFKEKIEKRMLRKEAAEALEKMFAAAEKDGIYLAGVSAYRSHSTQKSLFNRYVEKDGYEKARTYSALPGTSEHETGLAIDISGSDGKCAASDCFGDTKEAAWLAEHATEYGFIVRYPKGKEEITGYKYEPWHLRFVGEELSRELAVSGETLEEYYNAVPVAQ